MTREEVYELTPGDQVLLADGPFDGNTDGTKEAEKFWGTIATVEKIFPQPDEYPVKVEGCDISFHYKEVTRISDGVSEEPTSNADIGELFGMLGVSA